MLIEVRIPIAWRKYFGGNATVAMKEGKVRSLLQELESLYPDLQGQLLEADVAHPALNIIVDGMDIRILNDLNTFVETGSEMNLILEHRKG
ncbi:hypothetical protein [Alkalihalobacterium alkalinitrilicum]|uniref:hypothetical protein n=1 Tax=Alkalihalobacterium alkalinitrilicum TaxID=427920 RepID=UPI0009950D55|nr:hypothetical protein [Alkalihalobacterium alkalinitrilicum]